MISQNFTKSQLKMDLHRRKTENSSLLFPNLKALLVNENDPLKSGALGNENIQIVNWRKYSKRDNSISEYALPINFGKGIPKSVIYLKKQKV